MKKWLVLLLLPVLLLTGCRSSFQEAADEKPVIYLYPEEEMKVTVKLDYAGSLTSTYPSYNDGWNIIAQPDGTLMDPITGRSFYCLFWEGVPELEYDISEGFVVPGSETQSFLEWALEQQGLTQREANEFIVYWLPRMQDNAYNLIAFQQKAYTDSAVLTIDPTPDTLIRVFMTYQALEQPVEVPAQGFETVSRTGFTVVEWGGREISD